MLLPFLRRIMKRLAETAEGEEEFDEEY